MIRNAIASASLAVGVWAMNGSAGFGAEPAAAKLELARNGMANATLVLAPDATRAAQFAAFELQAHLNRITGGTFAIVTDPQAAQGVRILVGDQPAVRALGIQPAAFALQEYLIRFLPDTLILTGRDKDDHGRVAYDFRADPKAPQTWPDMWDEQGTAYAVYDFLERFCGVRWFDHTEAGMECPKDASLAVAGTDVKRAPRFRYRYASYYPSSNFDAYVSLWPAGSDGFKRWEAAAYADAHGSKDYSTAKFACVQLFRLRSREGGEMCACNHSLYGYYDRFLKPNPANPAAFGAAHPEWFAKGYPDGTPPQLCYTDPGLIEQVAKDAADYFNGESARIGLKKFQWGENFFAVEPMDNSSFCRCDRCQELIKRPHPQADVPHYSKGTDSNYFFYFVNEVAKRVKKTNPDKMVVTLAYMTHAYPPVGFHLEPNVAVQFCFASNRAPYSRPSYENDLAALKAWADEARELNRPLYLWLYYTFPVETANNGKYHCFPGFFAHAVAEQFKLFDQYGYRGMFHCGYGQEVESYVTYKLMDDPTRDIDALLDDYFSRCYGAAAEPMKKLYLGIEKTYSDPASYPQEAGHSGPELAWKYLGTEQRMAEFAGLLAEAKQKAATPLEKRRVELFDLGTWQYMLQGRRSFLERQQAPIPAVKATRVAAAGGDARKVDWRTAAELGGSWYDRGQGKAAARRLAGRIAHDGQYLYLELTDPCPTAKLNSSPTVFCYDDWEIFVAEQRALPSRQYAVNPKGAMVALSHGEVNWRMNVEMPEHGMQAFPDTTAPDKWVTRVSIPLAKLTRNGTPPGGRFFMNILRVAGPQISGTGIGIDTWVSYCTVHEVDRLAEISLDP